MGLANKNLTGCCLKPLNNLIFILPLLCIYEHLALFVETRSGLNFFMVFLLGDRLCWVPPATIIAVLIIQDAMVRENHEIRASVFVGMFAESLAYSLLLIMIGQIVFSLSHLGMCCETIVSYVGAGIYEEFAFRFCLIPLLIALMPVKSLRVPVAVGLSSILFSMCHHWETGFIPRVSQYPVFVFRVVVGVVLGVLFLMRGIGVAMWTHALYNLIIGWSYSHE